MNPLDLSFVSGPPGTVDVRTAALSLVLAAALAQAVAGTYMLTFRGLSYSRNFVQGIVLGAVVSSMLMLAIGDSVAAGIGLAGGLSIIRFRTTLRDPRDMVFVFAGLSAGMVSGLRAFPAAITGTILFCTVAGLLHVVGYGFRYPFDGVLRFVAPPGSTAGVQSALSAHAPGAALVMLRTAAQGDLLEHAYQIRLPDAVRQTALVSAVEAIEGTRDVRLFVSDPTQEL